MSYELIVGDCRTELAALPDASVDAVVRGDKLGGLFA